ncbi:MAG: hypothetical protein HY292_17455 [Planctomycetes bacterium]|nr:hypothetical protein [Planctomycetota bacterium]
MQWIYGVTEGGSSGSGLFDLNHRLVGQLRGGASSCSNPTGIDDYGKFVDSYGLISGWLQAGADDGLENDDSCAGARFLNPGYYGGLVVKSVDADWYRVDVPPLSRIAATIGFTHANGDIDFAMYDGCGGPLVSISSGVGNSETVTWDNRTSVTHSIYLNPYLYSDTRNDYAMNIVVAPCATEDSFEDNDTCATATPAGDSYYDSLFVSKTDPDWFRVTVYPYSTRYVAIYFTHAVADVDMIAYDDCGGSLVASSTGVGNSEVFPLTNSTDTTHDYFVNVYVYGFSAGNCNTYRFDASLPICVFDDGFENNDSCDVATAVASGTYGDLYSETGDPDWFHVSVPSGATLRCDVTGGGISVGDVDEFLFDDCGGNLVAYSNGRTNSESLTFVNAGDDRDFLLNISLDSGTCVSYTLTIDVTPGETLVGNVGVDAGAGPIDVLFVNGSSGAGPRRSLGISETEAIDVSLIAAPYGPLNARYAIFAWAAPPTAATASIIPYGIGRIAMNPLIPQCGSVCPIAGSVTIRTNCNRVRCSTAEATGALPPGVVMTFGAGRFAAGQTLFIQGVMRDNSDTSPKRVSVTNGVEVSIVP